MGVVRVNFLLGKRLRDFLVHSRRIARPYISFLAVHKGAESCGLGLNHQNLDFLKVMLVVQRLICQMVLLTFWGCFMTKNNQFPSG